MGNDPGLAGRTTGNVTLGDATRVPLRWLFGAVGVCLGAISVTLAAAAWIYTGFSDIRHSVDLLRVEMKSGNEASKNALSKSEFAAWLDNTRQLQPNTPFAKPPDK